MAQENDRIIASNRLARRNYELFDTWEAGLVLQGSEVKSLREAKVQISEAFGRAEGGQLWLVGLHISPTAIAATKLLATTPTAKKSFCCIAERSLA